MSLCKTNKFFEFNHKITRKKSYFFSMIRSRFLSFISDQDPHFFIEGRIRISSILTRIRNSGCVVPAGKLDNEYGHDHGGDGDEADPRPVHKHPATWYICTYSTRIGIFFGFGQSEYIIIYLDLRSNSMGQGKKHK